MRAARNVPMPAGRNSNGESGSSIVEVMVAMVVLTVAIIQTVGMLDAALRAAGASGDYDEARTCAGQRLEEARSLPYETVSAGLPDGACGPSGFGYVVEEEPVGTDLARAGADEGLTRVTVTVSWDGGSYSLTGVVSAW